MGRITGFFAGATVTLLGSYVALTQHQRSRRQQSTHLQQQAGVLNALVEPAAPASPSNYAGTDTDRELRFVPVRRSLSEGWKDRWNAEVEGLVRAAQHVDWDLLRAGVEGRLRALWDRAGSGSEGSAK